MAPPVLLRKRDGSRKRTKKGERIQVRGGYQLSQAEYDYYKEYAPDQLQRSLASGVFIPPEGVARENRASAPTSPPAGARVVRIESPERERLDERQQARQRLENILRDNPELASSDSVMLPNGKVIKRPTPDISVEEARQRVKEQMDGGRTATDYERELAFGRISTRREQERAQQELQEFLTGSLMNTGSIPNNINQRVLRESAGVKTDAVGQINIKRGGGGDGGSGAPKPPEGSKPPEGPKPSTAPGQISREKFTQTQKDLFSTIGTSTSDIGQARAEANKTSNPKETFRQILSRNGMSNDNITSILNSFES